MLELRAAHVGIRSFAMERSGSIKAKGEHRPCQQRTGGS